MICVRKHKDTLGGFQQTCLLKMHECVQILTCTLQTDEINTNPLILKQADFKREDALSYDM